MLPCRWELQLVAPGESAPLSGPRHQAVLSAFEQYSLAVEDIAEDASAAAAAAAAAVAAAKGRTGTAAAGSADATVTGDPAESLAVPDCSLGQILRARFDDIMGPAGVSDGTSAPGQQQQQQQQQQPASRRELQTWLAADASGQLKQAFAEGWGCR